MRPTFVALITLPLWAVTATSQTPETTITVPAGIYSLEKQEAYLDEFQIDAEAALVTEEPGACDRPSPEEWLVAAGQPGFKPSQAYEFLKIPDIANCDYSPQEAEAEGVAGTLYFGGKGQACKKCQKLQGSGDPKTQISTVRAGDYFFRGGKPKPMAARCVRERAAVYRVSYFVLASSLKLKAGRGGNYPLLDGLVIGEEVDEIHREGDWSYVFAKKVRSSNNCSYEVMGWIPSSYLSEYRPDAEQLLTEGKQLLVENRPNDATTPLERSNALRPGHRPTLEALIEAYQAAGQKDKLPPLRKELAKLPKADTQ